MPPVAASVSGGMLSIVLTGGVIPRHAMVALLDGRVASVAIDESVVVPRMGASSAAVRAFVAAGHSIYGITHALGGNNTVKVGPAKVADKLESAKQKGKKASGTKRARRDAGGDFPADPMNGDAMEEDDPWQLEQLLAHNSGVGPLLSAGVCRLAILLRANTVASGSLAGATPRLLRAYAAALNAMCADATLRPRVGMMGVNGIGDLQTNTGLALAVMGHHAVPWECANGAPPAFAQQPFARGEALAVMSGTATANALLVASCHALRASVLPQAASAHDASPLRPHATLLAAIECAEASRRATYGDTESGAAGGNPLVVVDEPLPPAATNTSTANAERDDDLLPCQRLWIQSPKRPVGTVVTGAGTWSEVQLGLLADGLLERLATTVACLPHVPTAERLRLAAFVGHGRAAGFGQSTQGGHEATLAMSTNALNRLFAAAQHVSASLAGRLPAPATASVSVIAIQVPVAANNLSDRLNTACKVWLPAIVALFFEAECVRPSSQNVSVQRARGHATSVAAAKWLAESRSKLVPRPGATSWAASKTQRCTASPRSCSEPAPAQPPPSRKQWRVVRWPTPWPRHVTPNARSPARRWLSTSTAGA